MRGVEHSYRGCKKLKIVVKSSGLNRYLHQLHIFVFCLGFIERTTKTEIKNIDQIIIRLQEVYEFDEVCVNNVKRYYGLNYEA